MPDNSNSYENKQRQGSGSGSSHQARHVQFRRSAAAMAVNDAFGDSSLEKGDIKSVGSSSQSSGSSSSHMKSGRRVWGSMSTLFSGDNSAEGKATGTGSLGDDSITTPSPSRTHSSSRDARDHDAPPAPHITRSSGNPKMVDTVLTRNASMHVSPASSNHSPIDAESYKIAPGHN